MEAHKVAEGDPFPLPKDPLHSFQVKLNYPPCLFEDVQCAHKFGSSNWPLAHFSACRGCCICSSPQTEGIHKALEACPWHGVTYNLPKYFSRFHVIFPWFLLFFAKFHDFSRCTLIFPGFPINVGTLLWVLDMAWNGLQMLWGHLYIFPYFLSVVIEFESFVTSPWQQPWLVHYMSFFLRVGGLKWGLAVGGASYPKSNSSLKQDVLWSVQNMQCHPYLYISTEVNYVPLRSCELAATENDVVSPTRCSLNIA